MTKDMKRYCIWNNKGGVGKTFLTYLMSTEYARKHPNEDVVVIDMCPQSNISEMLLGGAQMGQDILNRLNDNEASIASYIKQRYYHRDTVGEVGKYFIHVSEYNKRIPDNLYLLPGDVDLDICSNIIRVLDDGLTEDSWKNSRILLLELLNEYEEKGDGKRKTYFIDCNPSFAPYTELAIIAANNLIIPCTCDTASMRGLSNIFKILFKTEKQKFLFFASNARKAGLFPPSVSHVILNKSRSHQKNPSKAFKASLQKLNEQLASLRTEHRDAFAPHFTQVQNIKDGNTLAAVINYQGSMLGTIKEGNYKVYDEDVHVNPEQIKELKKDVGAIVDLL